MGQREPLREASPPLRILPEHDAGDRQRQKVQQGPTKAGMMPALFSLNDRCDERAGSRRPPRFRATNSTGTCRRANSTKTITPTTPLQRIASSKTTPPDIAPC